jgi:hypothetical protein
MNPGKVNTKMKILNFLISYGNEISSANKFKEYCILLNFYNQP